MLLASTVVITTFIYGVRYMRSIRFILATLLLMYSVQSLALFMPGGVRGSADTVVVSNDAGC